MNQIICTLKSTLNNSNNLKPYKQNFRKRNFLKFQLIILIIISLSLIIYYAHFKYDLYVQNKISENITKNFGITKIYNIDTDYTAQLLNQDIVFYESSSFFVIGIIDIEKINISYPILSDVSIDALKIATCRFYGPMPNEKR